MNLMTLQLSRRWKGLISVGIILAQSGCGTLVGTWDSGFQPDNLPMEDRLWHIVFPLSVAAAEHCVFKREETYGFFLEDVAGASSGVNNEPTAYPGRVRYVHPSLPAGKAGLAIGDTVVAMNGTSVGSQSAEALSHQIDRLTRARIQPLTLRVMQSGVERDVHLWAVPSCRLNVKVVESPVINALSDGSNIVLTSELLRFVRSPDQLAWVLAHELGHHALEHSERSRLQMVLNRFLRSTVGEASQSLEQVDLERQADLFAADLMVKAGFDLREARRLLKRIQTLHGRDISGTHPTTQERLDGLDRVIDGLERTRHPMPTS